MESKEFVRGEVNTGEKKPERLVHGGDWAGFEERFGYEPLDFSVNVSPRPYRWDKSSGYRDSRDSRQISRPSLQKASQGDC